MAETVTLELPDDVVHRARETARRTGRRMEDVMADWIGRAAANDEVELLVPGATYPIYTPYGNDVAAEELRHALASSEPADHRADQHRQ